MPIKASAITIVQIASVVSTPSLTPDCMISVRSSSLRPVSSFVSSISSLGVGFSIGLSSAFSSGITGKRVVVQTSSFS